MFFKVIYYFIGLLIVFIEMIKLVKVKEYVLLITDYSSWVKMRKKNDESTDWGDIPEEYKVPMIGLLIYYVISFIWLGIGIFTFNWAFVLSYIIFFTLSSKLRPKNQNIVYSQAFVTRTTFWIIFNICFYLFLILNTFHLHINFLDLF